MKLIPRNTKLTLFICAATLIATSIVGVAIAARHRDVWQLKQEKHPIIDTLPRIIHKVKDLKIVKATIADQGKPDARAVLEFKNNSDKAVTAFTVTFESISVGKDGGIDYDAPVTVIEPHGTTTLEIPVSNLDTDNPLIVAAVVYADGTEDGQDVVLELTHNQRAQAKAARDAKKEGGQPQ
jgi:hypothetical protein